MPLALPTNTTKSSVALAAALLNAVGCSAPGATREDDAAPVSAVTVSGELVVVMRSAPGPEPVRGTNTLRLAVTRAATGDPAEDLTLAMVPFMPAMGHGSSVEPRFSSDGGGAYRFDDVVLTMPGLWELRTTVTAPDADYVVFEVDVD